MIQTHVIAADHRVDDGFHHDGHWQVVCKCGFETVIWGWHDLEVHWAAHLVSPYLNVFRHMNDPLVYYGEHDDLNEWFGRDT